MNEEKFVGKYMRLAKQIGEDENPCYSRKIGVVIVHPIENRILGTGYNGPPRNNPHCDHPEYLEKMVWPQLNEHDKRVALGIVALPSPLPENAKSKFLDKYSNCKTCPRKIIKARSGERTELCSCTHAEANAIINASQNVHGAWMFAWCGIPCSGCSKLIINSGITKVYCLERYDGEKCAVGKNDYDYGGRTLLNWSGIELVELKPECIL